MCCFVADGPHKKERSEKKMKQSNTLLYATVYKSHTYCINVITFHDVIGAIFLHLSGETWGNHGKPLKRIDSVIAEI